MTGAWPGHGRAEVREIDIDPPRSQECDRLGQDSLKTKDLQEKVLALQVGYLMLFVFNVDMTLGGYCTLVTLVAAKSKRFLASDWDTYEPSSCWGAGCPGCV